MGEALMRVAAPLAVLAFWGGMAAAAHAYPAGYDWRYQTISALLYPDHDPHGYPWAWAGLELCGLAGIAWTVELNRRLAQAIAAPRATGLRSLRMGFVCMCCAVLPDRLLPLPKGHEVFAILAFLGICIGVTHQMSMVVDSRKSYGCQGTVARIRTQVWAVLPLIPLVLAGLTQAYLALARPNLPWVSLAWRERGISPFLSFGVWEWVTCVVFSVCLLVLWRRRPDG